MGQIKVFKITANDDFKNPLTITRQDAMKSAVEWSKTERAKQLIADKTRPTQDLFEHWLNTYLVEAGTTLRFRSPLHYQQLHKVFYEGLAKEGVLLHRLTGGSDRS